MDIQAPPSGEASGAEVPAPSLTGDFSLSSLSTRLSAIEDWLSESCTARHATDMADTIHEAWKIIDDLSEAEPHE